MSIENPIDHKERMERENALDDLNDALAEWRSAYLRAAASSPTGAPPSPSPVLILAGGQTLLDAARIGAVIDMRRPWPQEESNT